MERRDYSRERWGHGSTSGRDARTTCDGSVSPARTHQSLTFARRALTSFTVALSITLTLALYGVVRAPASLVEPLIAASIVLVAVLNLWQRDVKVAQRIAIVFACGLLTGQVLVRAGGMARLTSRFTVSQAASLVAAVVGAFWFIERVGSVSALLAQTAGVGR